MSENICWATDIHLSFVDNCNLDKFIKDVRKNNILILSGDISGGYDIKKQLMVLSNRLDFPIYFVLGNHDFYHKSIEEVYKIVTNLTKKRDNLVWLNNIEFIKISKDTAIIGHDGWYDLRFGKYNFSKAFLKDFYYISDLRNVFLSRVDNLIVEKCREFAYNSVIHIDNVLNKALDNYNKIILVTHVPPFDKATYYNGRLTDSLFLPLFSSKIMGDKILEIMTKRINKKLLILCGHTHNSAEYKPIDNVKVLVGKAEYRFPEVCMRINFDDVW